MTKSALLALPILFVFTAGMWADDHPIVVFAKTKLKDPTKPFALIVTVQAKSGKHEQVEATFAPRLKASRKDKGCISYDLHADPDKPRTYVLIEKWQSIADLDKHLQATHTQTLLKNLSDLLEGPPDIRVLRVIDDK